MANKRKYKLYQSFDIFGDPQKFFAKNKSHAMSIIENKFYLTASGLQQIDCDYNIDEDEIEYIERRLNLYIYK